MYDLKPLPLRIACRVEPQLQPSTCAHHQRTKSSAMLEHRQPQEETSYFSPNLASTPSMMYCHSTQGWSQTASVNHVVVHRCFRLPCPGAASIGDQTLCMHIFMTTWLHRANNLYAYACASRFGVQNLCVRHGLGSSPKQCFGGEATREALPNSPYLLALISNCLSAGKTYSTAPVQCARRRLQVLKQQVKLHLQVWWAQAWFKFILRFFPFFISFSSRLIF